MMLALTAACGPTVELTATKLRPTGERVLRVGVAPFDNLTGNPSAGPALTAAIVNELRRRNVFQLVELDTNAPGATERWTASKLGKEAKVDAVLVGVVTSYNYDRMQGRGGPTLSPAISVDLRLVSSKSADVVWAAGVDAKLQRLFSSDGMPLEQLAQSIAEHVAGALLGFGAQG
jgi:TolB-like protein